MKVLKKNVAPAIGTFYKPRDFDGATNKGFSIYAGLRESETQKVPLNLAERLAFAAGWWKLRSSGLWTPPSDDVHEVISYAFNEGFDWLKIPGELQGVYEPRLNPWPATHESVDDRLKSLTVAQQNALVDRLNGPIPTYTYDDVAVARNPGSHVLVTFITPGMMERTKADRFAGRIAAHLNETGYTWNFEPGQQRRIY